MISTENRIGKVEGFSHVSINYFYFYSWAKCTGIQYTGITVFDWYIYDVVTVVAPMGSFWKRLGSGFGTTGPLFRLPTLHNTTYHTVYVWYMQYLGGRALSETGGGCGWNSPEVRIFFFSLLRIHWLGLIFPYPKV